MSAGRAPKVWCWNDLWRAVREGRDAGPVKVSAAAARAALGLAIDRAGAAGALRATADAADWRGFRRRVADRIAAWTRRELPADGDAPDGGDPADSEVWSIYGHYRAVLRTLNAADDDGFAAWASRSLARATPAALKTLGTVTLLDPEDDPPCVRRALRFFEARAKAVRVVLGYDPDPALADAFAAVAPLRERFVAAGYEETCHGPDQWRHPGLRDVERELFRNDAHARPAIADAGGLVFLGGPRGEGVGLLVAREVSRLLRDERVRPEDVLVLVRAWDEDAEAVHGVLKSWGLPVSAVGRPVGLRDRPAVSALRRALRLPVEGYEATEVVRLLRHGRFRPDWPEAREPGVCARAAAAVRDSGVFRGRDALLAALGRSADGADDPARRARAAGARRLVARLFDEVGAAALPGTLGEHAARLRRLAASLGIAARGDGDDALERLDDALDDHAAVLDAAGEAGPVGFAEFVATVDRLAAESVDADGAVEPGTIALTTVDLAAGARARHVVLANLAEGTFPTRAAVDAADGRSFAREMACFLRAIGSADQGVVLAFPTRDEKGQEVLPAGFLDDLGRRLRPGALAGPPHEVVHRLDPALLDRPDLAFAPADARARAVGLACTRRQPGELARLATDPAHRPALEGAAAALVLTADRLGRRPASAYDGLLGDPAAVAAVGRRFGPSYVFSASQLESYLTCPFQFFAKYVLGLMPVDDRDDLDEDFIQRGNRLHRLLEELELQVADGGGDRLELSDILIRSEMTAELSFGTDAAPGLQAIQARRVQQALRRYATQMIDYLGKPEPGGVRPARFEVAFGADEDSPHLVIGAGESAVLLQGKIDRVDVVETADGTLFRVIDYKTGSCPSGESVRRLVMVQLPLYALAVERLALAGETSRLYDLGYWELRDAGYKRVKLTDWEADRARLEEKVVATAAALRSGLFVIRPAKDDCERTCDYAMVCRIGQVRRAVKSVEPRTTP